VFSYGPLATGQCSGRHRFTALQCTAGKSTHVVRRMYNSSTRTSCTLRDLDIGKSHTFIPKGITPLTQVGSVRCWPRQCASRGLFSSRGLDPEKQSSVRFIAQLQLTPKHVDTKRVKMERALHWSALHASQGQCPEADT